jgi:hypothetical protein
MVKKISENGKMVHSARPKIGPSPRSCGPGSTAHGGPKAVRRPSRPVPLAGSARAHRLRAVAWPQPVDQSTRHEEEDSTSTRGPWLGKWELTILTR